MTRPVFAREYKKFGLVRAKKPQTGYPLAGVVQVVDGAASGFVYVRFAEALVTAVGRAMPFGVSDQTPCFLRAVRIAEERWRISAYYFKSVREGRVLWESDTPAWLGTIRRGERRGTHTEAEKASTGAGE